MTPQDTTARPSRRRQELVTVEHVADALDTPHNQGIIARRANGSIFAGSRNDFDAPKMERWLADAHELSASVDALNDAEYEANGYQPIADSLNAVPRLS